MHFMFDVWLLVQRKRKVVLNVVFPGCKSCQDQDKSFMDRTTSLSLFLYLLVAFNCWVPMGFCLSRQKSWKAFYCWFVWTKCIQWLLQCISLCASRFYLFIVYLNLKWECQEWNVFALKIRAFKVYTVVHRYSTSPQCSLHIRVSISFGHVAVDAAKIGVYRMADASFIYLFISKTFCRRRRHRRWCALPRRRRRQFLTWAIYC